MKSGRLTVVTVVLGDRDNLLNPHHSMEGHDLICFTDQPIRSRIWKVKPLSIDGDPRAAARRVKALIHEYVDAEVVLWIDGSMEITSANLRPFVVASLRRNDMASHRHPQRTCIYEEGDVCLAAHHIDSDGLAEQLDFYRSDGHPEKGGLFATGILARRLTDDIKELGELWWQEMKRGSFRDQVSLPYVLRKSGVGCAQLPGSIYKNQHIRYLGHKESKRRKWIVSR